MLILPAPLITLEPVCTLIAFEEVISTFPELIPLLDFIKTPERASIEIMLVDFILIDPDISP